MYAIEVQTVVKRYGTRTVLDGFSCAVSDGECVALCGPSGCGKSTLLRLIAGIEPLDSGAILFYEQGAGNGLPKQMLMDGLIGMMFQDYALWPDMRAARHVEFVLKNRGLSAQERRQRANDLLTVIGMESLARAFPGELSSGEQQRLAFARAVATNPKILLLDEPFSNLDAESRGRLIDDLIRRKETEDTTIVIATHDPGEAFAVADRRIDVAA
jgi:ABC-type Fe3+/spermidine/putrescine transport system ATPase subunit